MVTYSALTLYCTQVKAGEFTKLVPVSAIQEFANSWTRHSVPYAWQSVYNPFSIDGLCITFHGLHCLLADLTGELALCRDAGDPGSLKAILALKLPLRVIQPSAYCKANTRTRSNLNAELDNLNTELDRYRTGHGYHRPDTGTDTDIGTGPDTDRIGTDTDTRAGARQAQFEESRQLLYSSPTLTREGWLRWSQAHGVDADVEAGALPCCHYLDVVLALCEARMKREGLAVRAETRGKVAMQQILETMRSSFKMTRVVSAERSLRETIHLSIPEAGTFVTEDTNSTDKESFSLTRDKRSFSMTSFSLG